MSIILSISNDKEGSVWAAGPEGLFKAANGDLHPIPQPQRNLYCCCVIYDRILVGGLPHGVAFSMNETENWQAGWMDNVEAPVVSIAADPQVEETGVILAGTDGGGVLRTTNRGSHWYTHNFGLRSFTVLALAWAPPAPSGMWPRWQTVFACTEEGVYHSPNGGRGWKRAECPKAVYQALAVGPDFHSSGLVLAGTEGEGLCLSVDGGHTFQPVPDSPRQVNALAAMGRGWLLSDENQIWRSSDGLRWEAVPGSEAVLVFSTEGQTILAGNEQGLVNVEL